MVDQIPYQAYKSKRHSRTISSSHLSPNVSPPPLGRPVSVPNAIPTLGTTGGSPIRTHNGSADGAKVPFGSPSSVFSLPIRLSSRADLTLPERRASPDVSFPRMSLEEKSPPPLVQLIEQPPPPAPIPVVEVSSPPVNEPAAAPASPVVQISADQEAPASDSPTSPTRKASTFRRMPLRNPSRQSLPSSPLRPPGMQTRTASGSGSGSGSGPGPGPGHGHDVARQFDSPARPAEARARMLSSSSLSAASAAPRRAASPLAQLAQLPALATSTSGAPAPREPPRALSAEPPASRAISPAMAPSRLASPTMSPSASSNSVPTVHSQVSSASPSPSQSLSPAGPGPFRASASSAPYRPGFQPKGVYRPRTDEYVAARAAQRSVGKSERTRLERRLEKLVALHFGPGEEKLPPVRARRASSFFDVDFSELRSKGAAELWKGVVQSQALQGGNKDVRAAEQKITPWEEDASVSQCPHCSTSFHPLTNRKHHCRLCGRIICSLPVKRPQRPVPCSILFVVDQTTGRIEEVTEGVDYGVRRRTASTAGGTQRGKQQAMADEEKFLKGVRICRDCRPVLQRTQYIQESHQVPLFARLHQALISLEKEIEDDLPVFHELMLGLNGPDDRPTKEASATRKRLLDAFAQYDALSKRIRALPCPGGKGSSQDRVQAAVLVRANLFLQKNMFPLQSMPKLGVNGSAGASPNGGASPDAEPAGAPALDPDSELAHALQPLLEQEALLEAYVEEATAHRKLEDARTLRANLREIRAEIQRVFDGADGAGVDTAAGAGGRAGGAPGAVARRSSKSRGKARAV